MNIISDNIAHVNKKIPADVKLVAVSKTKPVEDILIAYNSGQRLFGENRVQELIEKNEKLPEDIQWHMIGHLQTNKVKYIAPYVSMIESVDSVKLLEVINREALKNDRIINCLIQYHIAREESKHGFVIAEFEEFLDSGRLDELKNVKIRGVMGMGTFTDDMEIVRSEFRYLRSVFDNLKKQYFGSDDDFCEVSMGMSADYLIAIEEGSTIIRLGTTIFGSRFCSIDKH